jgi:hypothetical protein
LRGWRGVFVASCVFATLGLLILGLAGPWRNAVVEPGPLTSVHTQALEQVEESGRCAACHEAAIKDPLAWLKIASGSLASLSDEQAERCLKCHEKSLGSQFARSPHNVAPEALAQATQRIGRETRALDDILRVKLAASGEKACSTCHQEHQGAHANIALLTDQQCQACHVRAFKSFADGHPEFRHAISSRRSEIEFDHVSHVQKHFPEKHESFTCNRCHEDDARRDVKRLAGFDRSCGQCHAQPIEASGKEGLIAFSFPTLNVDELRNGGHDVGKWPTAAQGDFDGALPLLVRTMLMSDNEAIAALEQLSPQFDFSQTRSEELPSVASLAWGYKRLLNDLAEDAPQVFRNRLIAAPTTEVVLRQLPPGLFREARRRWLAGLDQELATAGRTQPTPFAAVTTVAPQIRSELLIENPLANRAPQSDSPMPTLQSAAELPATEAAGPPAVDEARLRPTNSSDPAELVAGGAWYLDDATLSVRYRPRGHGDELVRLLIDIAAAKTNNHTPQSGMLTAVLAEPAYKSCIACHSIDTSGEHYAVNWQIQYRDTSRRKFNEFSHRPHLTQPSLSNCTHCHQLRGEGPGARGEGSDDPMAHAHDFHPITKVTCATCHSTTQTGGRCTLCHSYHAGAMRGQ